MKGDRARNSRKVNKRFWRKGDNIPSSLAPFLPLSLSSSISATFLAINGTKLSTKHGKFLYLIFRHFFYPLPALGIRP